MNKKSIMVVEILRNFLADRLVYGGKARKKFLEIGCGSGSFSVEMGKKGFFGKGIDLSEEAVEWSRDLAKHETVGDRITFECVNFFDLQEEGNYARRRKLRLRLLF
jgi:2-polyprenyl-3-methyl-5-hydroxy-6-metoxy-1,4-benzoquinol methylase